MKRKRKAKGEITSAAQALREYSKPHLYLEKEDVSQRTLIYIASLLEKLVASQPRVTINSKRINRGAQ